MGRRKGSLNKSTLAKLHADGKTEPALPASTAEAPLFTEPPPIQTSEAPAPVAAAVPDFIEYLTSSGEKWRIEQGAILLTEFDLSPEEMAAWHGAIAPEERVWRIIRSRFGIAPLLAGPDDAPFMAPTPLEKIAESLSIDVKAVTGEIDAAKAFWVRWKMSHSSKIDAPAQPDIARSTPEERETALKTHGFGDMADENERTYVYSRIQDLKHKLEDEEGKTIAQRCIRVELRMLRNDQIMAKLEREAAAPGTDAEKASSLRGSISGYHGMGNDLSREHLELMRAMNATQEQNPSIQRKVAFVDCIGQMIRGMQDYYSRGDNTIIDGVFTAAEVKILTKPLSLRPAQYRLDLVMMIRDAIKYENLWNPDYEPIPTERALYRRMRGALAATLAAAENDSGTLVEMEDDGMGGEEIAPESVNAATESLPPAENGSPQITGVSVLQDRRKPGARPGEDFTTG